MEPSFVAAFLVGLLGSVHCIGMCGGIVGALTMGLPEETRTSRARMLPYQLLYNAGRISSYMIAGALAGLLGSTFAHLPWQPDLAAGKLVAGVFMVALGVYVAGWWQTLAPLERWGMHIWRHIEPLGRKILPVRGPSHAFLLGLVWGWLPCGMVYAALAWSATTASPETGSLLMLAFGLGTLPMLLAMGSAAQVLGKLVRQPVVRQVAGTLVILLGVFTLAGSDHQHRGTTSAHDVHSSRR